jgi:hypothetical protein
MSEPRARRIGKSFAGRTFGNFIVEKREDDVSPSGWSAIAWVGRCKLCHRQRKVRAYFLNRGEAPSCRCERNKTAPCHRWRRTGFWSERCPTCKVERFRTGETRSTYSYRVRPGAPRTYAVPRCTSGAATTLTTMDAA